MVPNAVVVLDAVPMTPAGKLDRAALPIPMTEGDEESFSAATSSAERMVEKAWRDVLEMERISINANFFEIGGHSLLVTKLHVALKEAFGKEFPMVKLFEHATIAAQARFLGASEETPREDGGERGNSRREAMKNRRRRGRGR
jgi:acyl carrier protein